MLDAGPGDPTDIIVIGIDGTQRAGSDAWWHAELRPLAEKGVPVKKQ